MTRTLWTLCALLAVAAASLAADKPTLTATPCELPLTGAAIVVVEAGSPPPGQKKDKPTASGTVGKAVDLPGTGPFDVYAVPTGGVAVPVREKWTPKAGKNELQLDDELGGVRVRGDDLPRASRIVLTAKGDPGPDSDDHVPVQAVTAYSDVLVAPPGRYAVWVVPANGARATKVADQVKVTAGRTTRVPEE